MKHVHGLRSGAIVLVLAGLSVVPPAWGAEGDWPSFQNGGHLSLTSEVPDAALTLSDEIAWTASLPGYGQSTPVVWDRQVYVTSVAGPNKETYFVSAFRLDDGSALWKTDIKNATPQENSNYVSKAAPTPAVDDNGVVCFFEGGNLIALTHAGEMRWQRNLVDEYGAVGSRHGLSASVEQDATSAYVWVERAENPYVLSVNKATGETSWNVPGVGATSWASPRLVPVGEGRHLVLSAIGNLVGLDPQTGERLWTFTDIAGNSTPTPIPLGEGRFLIGATVGQGESGGERAAESNGVVAITKNDDGEWQADYVWRAKRATSSFGSPIAHDGTAFFVNRTGVLYGLDLNTGEERFAKRLTGSTWATPLAIDNRLFFFGKDGRVNVVRSADDGVEVATWAALPTGPASEETEQARPSSGSVMYAAAWCGDLMVLRRGETLFAVRTVREQPSSTANRRTSSVERDAE